MILSAFSRSSEETSVFFFAASIFRSVIGGNTYGARGLSCAAGFAAAGDADTGAAAGAVALGAVFFGEIGFFSTTSSICADFFGISSVKSS